jgi:hypothetical protein
MPDHRDVRHTGKQIRPGEVRPQVRTGQVRPARQRGAASLEFWVVCLALLPLVLGSFQGVLLYNAKSVLNQATFEAARIGAVQHAQVAPMQAELARRLAGFYGPTNSAQAYPQAYAKALTDITTPVTPDQRVGSGTTIRILNPTREAFNDFGEDLDGKRQIPNHHLKRRDTAVGPTSSVNIQDANLLKLEVTYGYRMTVPIAAPLIAAVMQIADPAHAAYYQASPPRLPLKASALVRMHSPAWLSAANVSVSAALNPGGAGGIGDGQGYQPLPGIGTGGIDGAPDDTDPNAGYQPGDHTPIDTSPPDEGDDEGEGEGGTDVPYKCQGPDWTESWRIIKEGSAMERAVLARDILIAAVAGFGDQLYDLGVLIKDMGEAAWDIGNDIAEVGLGEWLRSKLQDAADAAGKAIDFMKDIDRVIASIEKLWNEREAIIEELKNGIGQELYNLYIAPIECGPVDTMRLITQNFTPRVPLKVITAFNKLRKAMNLPELPTNTPGNGKPDGDGGKPDNPDDPDGDGTTNPPGGLIAGKDRDDDGRDDDTEILCDISGGPARSSFRAGTPILTPEGLKPIETLQVGDLVQSRSDVDFSETPQHITETFHRVAPGYWHLRLETKRFLDVTAEHPIWQQGKGWVETQHYDEMRPAAAWGDDLMITHKTWIEGPVPVYNFSVEHTPSYFAGQDSLWVHNASGDCHYDPSNGLNYPIDAEIDWQNTKPKGPDWDQVPKTDVTKATRVAGGIRLEMIPREEVKNRFGLKEGETINIVYDEKGNPDFSNVRRSSDGSKLNSIPENGKVEITYAPLDPNIPLDDAKDKARREDYFKANKALIEKNGTLAKDIGVVNIDGSAKKSRPLVKGKDGKQLYSWHHSADGKGMELVDKHLHDQFQHTGGRANFDNNP